LYSFFDCIAGTSTGGIIALGLSLGKTADEIVEFYTEDGRVIFPPLPQSRLGVAGRFLGSLSNPRLDHEALEAALKKRFEEHLLGEALTRVVIPAFMMPKTEIAVFKTDHHADFKRDHLSPMWRVARATSAAPTYLKGLEDKESGKVFLDGGVWANNPVMIALVDALSCYDIALEQIEILSIGTGNSPFQLSISQALGGMIAWREAIKAAMYLTTDNATSQAILLLGPQNCVRIEPKGDAALVEMDDYDGAFKILPEAARALFRSNEAVLERFFAQTVAPREKHHSS